MNYSHNHTVSQSVCVTEYVSVSQSVSQSVLLCMCQSVSQSVLLCMCQSVSNCVSVCLFTVHLSFCRLESQYLILPYFEMRSYLLQEHRSQRRIQMSAICHIPPLSLYATTDGNILLPTLSSIIKT